jgi:hypothetical protein
MSGTPAPGWYDDQHGSMRWWDGQEWTPHVRTAPAPDPTAGLASGTSVVPASAGRSAASRAAGAGLAILLVGVIVASVAYLAGRTVLDTTATTASTPIAQAAPTPSSRATARPATSTAAKPKPKPKRWHPRGWSMFSPTIAVHFLPVKNSRCEPGTSCASLLVASKTSCRVLTVTASTSVSVSLPTSMTDGDRVMRASARHVRAGHPVRLRLSVTGFSTQYELTGVVCRR